jgi:L,D-transpeptidase catalytic domain
MKKMIVCLLVCLLIAGTYKNAGAGENNISQQTTDKYIQKLFKEIDFSGLNCLSYEVFKTAMNGYLNLKNAGKLSPDRDILTICDMSLSANSNRMWIIDLRNRKVLFNTYVAHGQGSGEEYATDFSNDANSHQTSLGFYITGDTYEGEHGTSLRLSGMDHGYNDAAYDRGIVVHGANYVSNDFVAGNQRLGRSWGCPAVPAELSLPIIESIKGNTVLFIYYPDQRYLASSNWLNKRGDEFAQDNLLAQLGTFANNKGGKPTINHGSDVKPGFKKVTYQYFTGSKLDSSVTVYEPIR